MDNKLKTLLPEVISDSDRSQAVESDYNQVRATLNVLIEQGKEAIELAMEVARESEHPRSIEVLSGLLKNVADMTDKVMELNHSRKQYYERKNHRDPGELPGNTTYNFIGTTSELQKMIKEAGMKDVTPNSDQGRND